MTHDFDENNCCTRCGATLTLRPDALVYTRECTDAPNVIAISHLRARKIAEESARRASMMAVPMKWFGPPDVNDPNTYNAADPESARRASMMAVSIGPNGHFVFASPQQSTHVTD